MGEQKNTVVINGKTYDAFTGALIGGASSVTVSNNLVSDFLNAPAQTAPRPKVHSSKSKRSAPHMAHHKPQKSVTLKRSAPKPKVNIAGSRSMPIASPKVVTAAANKQLLSNSNRHHRAKQVSKSSAISRFNLIIDSSEPTVAKHHQPLAVKPAPPEAISIHQSMPVLENFPARNSQDIFDTALSQAKSHQQSPVKLAKRKHRLARKFGVSPKAANVMSIVLIVTVLGSFIAYQNASSLSMRLAVGRSGLTSATMPGYKPSGFSLDKHVATAPGQIVLSFNSNSDQRAFKVTQTGSNWNSQTLASTYLSNKQTRLLDQSSGKTVYLYDKSNATWVDGGIWYKIEGNSSLTSDQLTKIANSF